MQSQSAEFNEMKSYEKYLKETKLNTDFEELSFTKSKRKYELLKEEILKYEYETQFENTTLTEIDTKLYLYEYLKEILPNQKENLKSLLPLIKVNHQFLSSENDCVSEINQENKIKNIYVYSYNAPLLIPSCANEMVHALIIPKEEQTLSNVHYSYIPGMIIEKMISKHAEQTFSYPFYHNMESIRLNQLQQVIEIDQNLETCPNTFRKNEDLKLIIEMQKHSTFSYTISDIYATNLIEKYIEDEKKFLEQFRNLIDGNNTIKELLEYYQISLKNYETVSVYQKKIETIKKA